jgi:hypothetical protein
VTGGVANAIRVDGGLNPRLFGDFALSQHSERRRYLSGVSAI